MKKFTIMDLLTLIFWIAPIVYLVSIYRDLPATIPVHFGADGRPNGFGPKIESWVIQGIMSGVSIALFFLFRYLPQIDPKKKVQLGEDTFRKLSFGMMIFLSVLSVWINMSMLNGSMKSDNVVFVLISLLFVFMGNMMYNVKPNYFFGVRTPWTLENEGTWRATHRLAGKLWVGGGLVLTIATLLLHGKAAFSVFMGGVLLLAFIPIIYSYLYFKQHRTGN